MPYLFKVKVKGAIPLEFNVTAESEETLQRELENMLKPLGYETIEIVSKELGKSS